MTDLKDLIVRYCLLFGRRFSYKEKIAFLRVIAKELIPLGYAVDAKLAKLKLRRNRYANYYNAYIGDLNHADIIVATYYDTGINSFNLSKTYPFQRAFSKKTYLIGLLPTLVLTIMAILLALFIILPTIQTAGILSPAGVISALGLLLCFYLIMRFRSGIPNKNNFVCNSSTIIVLLSMIQKLDPAAKKRIAFVLYDGGCTNQFGLRMLEDHIKNRGEKQFIFLDSIGNSESLHFFKPAHFDYQQQGITFNQGEIATSLQKYILITAGERGKDNQIVIKHANSSRDKQLSEQIALQHTNSLHQFLMTMLTAKAPR
ncbi:hypothetical protein PT276_06265 [Orbaceae bacterium ESL0721]|nr:hypothetical protein [Orbaceae bacterium ESL0721]